MSRIEASNKLNLILKLQFVKNGSTKNKKFKKTVNKKSSRVTGKLPGKK